VIASTVSACVAKNPVLKADEWKSKNAKAAEASGVVFSLPQMRMNLQYSLVKKSFKARAHTAVVDACELGTLSPTEKVCRLLHDNGIDKTARFSDNSVNYAASKVCSTDGSNEETRIELADSPALAADFVPDPNEIYVIPLKRSYFQNFELSLELNPNGTVGKGSISTENLGAQELLTALSQIAGSAIHGQLRSSGPPSRGAINLPPPSAAVIADAIHEVEELAKLRHTLDELVAKNNDDALASRAVQIDGLKTRIARLKESFTGVVKETPIAKPLASWIPGRTNTTWLVGAPYDYCGGTVDAKVTAERLRQVAVAISGEGPTSAPRASGTLKTVDFATGKGWPYRVPSEREVSTGVFTSYGEHILDGEPRCSETIKPPCVPAGVVMKDLDDSNVVAVDRKRMLIPQFGETLRFPQATGGKKSVVAPEYYADGSLKKVDVSHVGESPAPLIVAAHAAVTPTPKTPEPTETATLKSAAELIQARQALCRLQLNVEDTDERCKGPNPPTTPTK